jgi:putative tricarboxylic transport membrane protein
MEVGAFDLLGMGFDRLFHDYRIIFYLVIGVTLGLFFGVIPGLTAALAILLLLPFTFGMDPAHGLGLLVAIYVGGVSGAMVASILINIPGSPASLITTYDGYPMAQQGRANEALSIALFSSLFGGIISAVFLIFAAPQLASIALKFSYWEYLAFGILGMCVVVAMESENLIKGLLAVVTGVWLAAIGFDPVLGYVSRYDFGFIQLLSGIAVFAVIVGVFAISEILIQVESIKENLPVLPMQKKMPFFPSPRFIWANFRNLSFSSLIGIGVGIVPGIGQTSGSILAYNQAQKFSKSPKLFGKGNPEGIVASEAANNAVNGGAMVPLMTLGIPGDLVTLLLLGGFLMHGLHAGPLLFRDSPALVGSIFVAFLLANVLMYFIGFSLMRVFVRLLRMQTRFLFPILLVFAVLGTYASNNRFFDLWVMILLGIGAYLLIKNKFPLLPLGLGYILGPIVENNFRRGLIADGHSLMGFFDKPIAVALIILSFIVLFSPFILKIIAKRK